MRLLLDTNIVLAYVRETTIITDFVDAHYELFHPDTESLISIVTVGELESLAIRNRWGTDADFGHLKTTFLAIDQIPVRPK